MTDFATARQKMVDGQVRPSDVTDIRILDAMLAVPRETFLPSHLRKLAYLDMDVELGPSDAGAGHAKRYLIKPVVLARMLQAADVAATDRALVVGPATGYAVAVLSRLAGQVTAADPDRTAAGDVSNGPYDLIVIDGATEIEPRSLYGQLAPAGRLVGVFATSSPQRAVLVTRSHDDFGVRALFDASAPVLPGLERVAAFVF